jgi:hypothetical protein
MIKVGQEQILECLSLFENLTPIHFIHVEAQHIQNNFASFIYHVKSGHLKEECKLEVSRNKIKKIFEPTRDEVT